MNPITLLTNGINELWFWTYGLVAGWGLTFTVLVVAVLFLSVKVIRLSRRVTQLETRLIHAERDYNITLTQWQK